MATIQDDDEQQGLNVKLILQVVAIAFVVVAYVYLFFVTVFDI
jgi:hypothetical protein